ncbi:AarF/ABC1/UbiB kinase family protein [uncultured Amphritea sp.]|uniref:ABC1 kinase family protein n=1 Tax=uncultured Amphritea sp. TaxID=981605 RepID=UPI002606DC36|nr:AarF/ABC1/UbiB kinase family protein [uncultured Amphritea sp.]
MDDLSSRKSVAVPKSRISRLSQLGSLAGRVAGNMLADGGKQLVQGRRPVIRDLLVTEKNLSHLADKLATMRGAAMKAGQLLSMDSGSLLPRDMAVILERLRSDAVTMPATQLLEVLERNWGDQWQNQFKRFSFNPIAAASIGQVHRGVTVDQREMAIKIQYPGVKQSIDSDLDNVFGLLRMSGLIPRDLDITPLVDEARIQLKREADYCREGLNICQYTDNLSTFKQRDQLLLPAFYGDISTDDILCMSYMPGQPLDKLASAPQDERNRVVTLLMELFFAEFFTYHCVQTDPNLANYLYVEQSKKLGLLDFGATRDFCPDFVCRYKAALKAAVLMDKPQLHQALEALGFFNKSRDVKNADVVLDIFILATEPMRFDGEYDFAQSQLADKIRDKGLAVSGDPDAWHTPPPDVLFLHRKMAGLYLIANRFSARVNIKKIVSDYF